MICPFCGKSEWKEWEWWARSFGEDGDIFTNTGECVCSARYFSDEYTDLYVYKGDVIITSDELIKRDSTLTPADKPAQNGGTSETQEGQ